MRARPRTAVIVQARIGSVRLPGKTMMDLSGRTLIERVLERCRGIDGIDEICCAIPDTVENDPLAEKVRRCDVRLFRGSESDVLDRYYRAAIESKAEIILRITGDCPLLDPYMCAEVLNLCIEKNATYSTNCMPAVWPHGLDCEAFPFIWLEKAASEANETVQREHVSPYIRFHKLRRIAVLKGPNQNLSFHRWTVDTREDLAFMRALLPLVPEGPSFWHHEHILDILEERPDIIDINRGIGKKNWDEYCDLGK